ncbi:HAD domain-containing protein [Noviherbaspirillum sedimenti]|uniref:Uncharacterized protein n=1 Tax=Noviherbaspirillum sedimenti TaxID=2320865 RepID=A0A3A3G7C9_9BURK|nr:HAD domain-containing protein [Noviherbaspirillum sedimenti]RJG02639.1 hypothetical protein D3878_14520 [Noviherbaspirillum sedimenti]
MILFLDFDGVLHPEFYKQGEELFCRRDKLETILRDYPQVEIVISSTWRQTRSLSELQALFSPDIGPRIIGVTPDWRDLPELCDVIGNYPRHVEVEGWLRQANRVWESWVALDDRGYWFRPFLKNLVMCDAATGINDVVEVELRFKLSH